jgi:hypothetical protein
VTVASSDFVATTLLPECDKVDFPKHTKNG